MIDIKLIRDSPEVIKENLKRKDQTDKLPLIDKIKKLDEEWRKIKGEGDSVRASRNTISKEISEAKKAGKDTKDLMKKAASIPDEIAAIEVKMQKKEEEINDILKQIPNIISKHTPKGKDSSENVEIKKWGKIPKFNFPVKNHVELAENLDLADFDSSARVSGSGFYYIKKELAKLNQALIRFTLDYLGDKKDYIYIEPPLMLHTKEIFASMDKSAIEQSVYSIKIVQQYL